MSVRRRRSPQRVPAPTQRVRFEWLRRVEAEYRSAAITQHLGLWLIQIAASPELVEDSLRIVADELAHAELSHAVFAAAEGEGAPSLARETLGLVRNERRALELDVLDVAVETFCLGETVAVRLFKGLRSECSVPSARRALDRILRDEVRHRDFGWALLAHLLEGPHAAALRARVQEFLPLAFQRVRQNYAPEGAQRETELPPEERAWGLMPMARYAETLQEVFERDYTPRFAALDVDATAAWAAAERLPAAARRQTAASVS